MASAPTPHTTRPHLEPPAPTFPRVARGRRARRFVRVKSTMRITSAWRCRRSLACRAAPNARQGSQSISWPQNRGLRTRTELSRRQTGAPCTSLAQAMTEIVSTKPAVTRETERIGTGHQHRSEARYARSQVAPADVCAFAYARAEDDQDSAPTRRNIIRWRRRPSCAPVRCGGVAHARLFGFRCLRTRASRAPVRRPRRARRHGCKRVQEVVTTE